MSIPKHDDIRLPILQLLREKGEMRLKDLEIPLAKAFDLTEEEMERKYPSGNAYIFYDRISWALSYLNMAGLLNKPRRAAYKINELGLELLKTPEKINEYVSEQIELRKSQREENKVGNNVLIIENDSKSELTPQEKLYASFDSIKESVYNEVINTILSKTPDEFEKLVIKLLQAMGYGGEIKDSGTVTQKSRDGGIDGVIKEDILGLGRVYIQAKRYNSSHPISRPDLQKFVGALAVTQSKKGVFITTSYFSRDAIDYVENLHGGTILVLLDGNKLAEYIYDYGIGMQVEQIIKLKKLDSDFWDSMKDEESI